MTSVQLFSHYYLCFRDTYRFFIFFFWLLVICVPLYAQEDYEPKFGVVSKVEFEQTSTADTTAEAIFLYDRADVHFKNDATRGILMINKYWGRIKLVKESSLDRASITVPIIKGSYNNQEVITNIEAVTYNIEGTSIKPEQMNKNAVVRDHVSDKQTLVKFNLPNARKGSIIEFTYTIETPLKIKNRPDRWTFQGSIPVNWSEYRITIPSFLYYKMLMGGYLNLHINNQEKKNYGSGFEGVRGFDNNVVAHRYVVKDAPAFRNEPFISTPIDYLSSISFELEQISLPGSVHESFSTTWASLDKTLSDVNWFGKQVKKWPFIKEAATEISKKSADPKARLWLAVQQTRNTIKWNEEYSRASDLKKAFDNKKGDAGDVNMYLVNLLRELGFKANPAVLSTRSHGYVSEHNPRLESFNYIVSHVEVGDKEMFVDATDPYLVPGMLPERALNTVARVIYTESGTGKFVGLEPTIKAVTYVNVEGEIDASNGELKGKYKAAFSGYQGLNWKHVNGEPKSEKYAEELAKKHPDWELSNVQVEEKKDSSTVTINSSYDFAMEVDESGIIYFNPMLASQIKSHSLTAPTRLFPLDFGKASNDVYTANFTIPAGYEIQDLPQSEVINLPDNGGRFLYQILAKDGKLSIRSTISLNKVWYAAEDYEILRQFYDLIVKKHAQVIAIKKKSV